MNNQEQILYRHEMKYLISNAQIKMLQNRINHLFSRDVHAGLLGSYNIRSLYFDDYYNRCYYENENGTDPREKFRIRIYNHSTEHISLECKRKEQGKTLKISCPLTIEQTEQLMQGKYIANIASQPPLLQKMTMEMMMHQLRPVVIVEYNRIPYVYENGNVRITFDTDVSSSKVISDFFMDSIPKRPIMLRGQQLMEVKFDEFLPDFIYRNLQLENLYRIAYSKYYLCRKFAL